MFTAVILAPSAAATFMACLTDLVESFEPSVGTRICLNMISPGHYSPAAPVVSNGEPLLRHGHGPLKRPWFLVVASLLVKTIDVPIASISRRFDCSCR